MEPPVRGLGAVTDTATVAIPFRSTPRPCKRLSPGSRNDPAPRGPADRLLRIHSGGAFIATVAGERPPGSEASTMMLPPARAFFGGAE